MSSLGDHMDSPLSETAKHSISITSVASSIAATSPRLPNTSSFGRRNRSAAMWNHFTVDPNYEKKAKCNYCGCLIKYVNGTSAMNTHLKRSKDNPNKEGNKRQKTVGSSTQTAEGQVSSSSTYFKFNQEACQAELVKMFVLTDLPLRFVENEAFREFMSFLQPQFSVPSYSELVRDILRLFSEERVKLMKFLSEHCKGVCLTIDTWTSIQNLNHMSLTAHFIDNNWKLHKKILNFCQVTGHLGEVMAKTIEICLNNWELNRVLSLTIDNASPNDPGIRYLKERLISWNGVILKGEYIHMRCFAHISSLIVNESLKEIDDSILRIHGAVRYIRSSSLRLAKFKACAEHEKISYKGLICLDVETRWNSTYLMLEAALKYQKAFELLEKQDNKYVDELIKENGKGVPSKDDWDYARSILPFLKMFYDAMMHILGFSYIISNIYMMVVFGIGTKIRRCLENNDVGIRLMTSRMKSKYDKYWGNPDGMNMLLLIAVVLDPRLKLDYVNWFLDYLFDSDKANELKLKLSSCLRSLYEQYQEIEEGCQSNQREAQLDEEDDDFYCMGLFLQPTWRRYDAKFELDKYLKEGREPYNKLVELDVLNWWKVNSMRFPILANIAREVLAIPVSTISSEFAFSIRERVLDSYRSSLTPRMMEALVCTRDWLKGIPFSVLSNEDFEELERLEQEMVSQHEVASSATINVDD